MGWKALAFACASGVIFMQPGAGTATSLASTTIQGRLPLVERGVVARVIDGNSFVLRAGQKVELSTIQTPRFARRDSASPDWPLAEAAKQALSDLIAGQSVTLSYGADPLDRYGRAHAQVHVTNTQGDQVWVQRALVTQGLARVYPWRSDTVDMKPLLRGEAEARKHWLGIWNTEKTGGFYAVRSPEPNALIQHIDSVQIVEGIVISSANVRGTHYLNFGSDYKTDFTIAVAKRDRRKFEKAGIDLNSLSGARVRVRGYIELGNGPVIWLSVPSRLEILN